MNSTQIAAIKKMVIGNIIAEYGCIQLQTQAQYQLKNLVNRTIAASNKVQEFLKNHPNSTAETKQMFHREFLKSEIVLIAEIFELLICLSEEDLQLIYDGIKQNMAEEVDIPAG